MLLAGAWVPRRARMEVRNPENGAFIGSVPRANAADVELALDSAFEARGDARAMPVHMRASILSKAATLLEKDSESFARTIAAEGIKTIREARQEVVRAAMTLRLAGEEAGRLVGETISFSQRPGSERRSGYFVYEPVGVVVAITPFNDPLNLVAHKVGPAIAAGNAVILKPHGKTPFSAIRLAQVLQRAGLPDNVLQVITGSGAEIGDQLVSDRRVRMVSFTGGRSTGERQGSKSFLWSWEAIVRTSSWPTPISSARRMTAFLARSGRPGRTACMCRGSMWSARRTIVFVWKWPPVRAATSPARNFRTQPIWVASSTRRKPPASNCRFVRRSGRVAASLWAGRARGRS